MTITVSTADPRSLKALAILETADRWVRGHRKADGRSFYAVPSQTGNLVYMVDTRECTCEDFRRRQQPCKHILAVRLHVARVKAQQRPAPKMTERQAAAAAKYAEIFGAEG